MVYTDSHDSPLNVLDSLSKSYLVTTYIFDLFGFLLRFPLYFSCLCLYISTIYQVPSRHFLLMSRWYYMCYLNLNYISSILSPTPRPFIDIHTISVLPLSFTFYRNRRSLFSYPLNIFSLLHLYFRTIYLSISI